MADRGGLRPGDVVRVRQLPDILRSLDAEGRTDGLPFMPEMLRYCGNEFTVFRRAHKVCDTVDNLPNKRLDATVHLADLRCDGAAHGGCQTGCLLLWKESWLEHLDGTPVRPDLVAGSDGIEVERVTRAAVHPSGSGPTRYSCQATALPAATSPMRKWDIRQYVEDVTSGNTTLWAVLRTAVRVLANHYQELSARVLPARLLLRGGRRFDDLAGPLTRTPSTRLDLQPGELVRVKTKDEIIATLDGAARNRGLAFEPGMVQHCGRLARVQGRVGRIIDERTGELITLRNDCVVLEGVTCSMEHHLFCPRAMYPYWREVWLERVVEGTAS